MRQGFAQLPLRQSGTIQIINESRVCLNCLRASGSEIVQYATGDLLQESKAETEPELRGTTVREEGGAGPAEDQVQFWNGVPK